MARQSHEDAEALAQAVARSEDLQDEVAYLRASVTVNGGGRRRGLLRRDPKPQRQRPQPLPPPQPVEGTFTLVDEDTEALLERRLFSS